ncbi:class I SAM-dependent methyltransferase [Fuscovulum blasticum]|uniref:class I SAM-dependent methyltransferase n=1 Tax=Fuscovulum blasticum TaxID=1075 RepID=UPI000D3E7BE9|nr:methyltransferase [Fuscovulum blasticum]AWD22845.1 MFS transporter [Fuscovulum blasticum]
MQSSRLEMALAEGALVLPPEGRIAVYRPQAGDDLSALPRDRVVVLTGFRPDHDAFRAAGYAVDPAPPYAAALVCLPRARDHARALLAEAAAAVVPGGPVVVDGQKTDGIDPTLKDLRARVALGEALSKAHGKLAVFPAGPGLEDWAARPRPVEGGFVTRPGVFSADGADRGSALLAAALPAKLGPKVVDLGAGWGYLSAAVLAREGVKRLDLVEAEADALACARDNITDPRAQFHWADATGFRPASLVETVVMNPPFHTTRAADPGLGAAFIAAARRMLAPDGVLWLVANRHLPYDAALTEHFLTVEDIGGDAAFRLIRAAKPRRATR